MKIEDIQRTAPLVALPDDFSNTSRQKRLLSVEEIIQVPPMKWLIHGVLPQDGLAALYGLSGSGKSFLALDLAVAVAEGSFEWFGHRVKACPVTYACLEGRQGIANRVKALNIRPNIPFYFASYPLNLLKDSCITSLAQDILDMKGGNGLVIIDTLNQAASGADENSSKDMGAIIAGAMRLQARVGGLVMLIHHAGKSQGQGLRGHSSLHAALDTVIEVRINKGQRSWKVEKCKDGEDGYQFFFRLETVVIGQDEQGQDLTSCIVRPGTQISTARATAELAIKYPSGDNQKIAKRRLDELLKRACVMGKGGAPEGRPCILFDEAIDSVAQHLPCDRKHQKERSKKAIASLVSHGFYCIKDGWLWQS